MHKFFQYLSFPFLLGTRFWLVHRLSIIGNILPKSNGGLLPASLPKIPHFTQKRTNGLVEVYCCCCSPFLPQHACNILTTTYKPETGVKNLFTIRCLCFRIHKIQI